MVLRLPPQQGFPGVRFARVKMLSNVFGCILHSLVEKLERFSLGNCFMFVQDPCGAPQGKAPALLANIRLGKQD